MKKILDNIGHYIFMNTNLNTTYCVKSVHYWNEEEELFTANLKKAEKLQNKLLISKYYDEVYITTFRTKINFRFIVEKILWI